MPRLLTCLLLAGCAAQVRPYTNKPIVWQDDDRHPVSEPERYWSPMYWDVVDQTFFEPIERALGIDIPGPAQNVNALGEVPSSSWFENRLGLHDLTPEQAAEGPCAGAPINEEGLWLAKSGKVDGANPGFVIQDTTDGRMYLLKFDSAIQPERATVADVTGSKLYWAFGFSTPCNRVVHFELENLRVAEDANKKDRFGNDTPLTEDDVAAALLGAPRRDDGRIRGSASLFIPGKVLGPFRYHGTRSDDPNDVVPHEDRRELRGSRLIAAWLNHFDAREQNSLTTFIKDDSGKGYVAHHMIDFGDCYGSEWDWDGMTRRLGYSYYLDLWHITGDLLTLGFIERPWDVLQRNEEAPIFGYFDIANFVPSEWKVAYPNVAFDRMDDGDAYWAAKIISRFTDAHIKAVVAQGELSNPLYERYIERVLIGRRDAIVREYLYPMTPLDFPSVEGGSLCLKDLLVDGGYEKVEDSFYRARVNEASWQIPVVDEKGRLCVAVDGSREHTVVEMQVRRVQQSEYARAARFHLMMLDGEELRLIGVER